MGFDPRQRTPHRVTSNVEALLRENDALRREIQRLQRELERARASQWQQPSAQAPARISAGQVQAWGAALANQPGWSQLRQGGLELLIDQLNCNSFPSRLSLQQRLDRLVSGLGTDLLAAVGPRITKKTAAVLAAFALYGVRASEWLDEAQHRKEVGVDHVAGFGHFLEKCWLQCVWLHCDPCHRRAIHAYRRFFVSGSDVEMNFPRENEQADT